MQEVITLLEPLTDFSSATTETIVKEWITSSELSFGKVMPPLRLLIVGDMKGPHIFDILELIGKDETIARLKSGISILQ